MSDRFLIVGLGNPGPKYDRTRHNIGFQVIDELVARHGMGAGKTERRARTWSGAIGGARVKLAQPLTYMNRSGEAVRALLNYYEIEVENLLVAHDDLDTPFGSLRLRQSGGHGGQNGLRSILQRLGTRDFARLRCGIGRPPGRMDPVDYVLARFKGNEAIRVAELAGRAADAIEVWLGEGIESAMSQFNGEAAARAGKREKTDLAEQLKIFRRAHELTPSDPVALKKLIAAQKKLGALDEAAANHLKLAALFERADEPAAANAERVKAVSMRPRLVDVQREIAEWYRARGMGKKAVARYLILAEHLQGAGDGRGAAAEIEQALAINPQHPKALEMRRGLGAPAAK